MQNEEARCWPDQRPVEYRNDGASRDAINSSGGTSRRLMQGDIGFSLPARQMVVGHSVVDEVATAGGTSETENKSEIDKVDGHIDSQTCHIGRPCYKLGDEGRLIQVDIHDQKFALLVDTGSQVSVLSQKAYNRLPVRELLPTSITLNAVNLPVQGLARVSLKINRDLEPYDEEFLVAELTDSFEVDGILGMDIMRAHCVTIDLQRDVLTFDGEEMPCFGTDSGGVLNHELVMESGQAAVAYLTVPRNKRISEDGLVQPLPNMMYEAGLIIGRSLVDLREDLVPIPIINASEKTVKLKHGQALATIEPLEVVERKDVFCKATGIETQSELPGHLSEIYQLSSDELSKDECEKLKEVYLNSKMHSHKMMMISVGLIW